MNLSEKIRAIWTIKQQLQAAIISKGVYVEDDTPFAEYPARIRLINAIVDTTPPVIESFKITGGVDEGGIVTGKAEAGCMIMLKDPNNVSIPLQILVDGSFNATLAPGALEGVYILIVRDVAGNVTTLGQTFTFIKPNKNPIKAMFDSGALGAWYDINDLTTLFQDPDGRIPVTAVGQGVGFVKDKSGLGNHLYQLNANNMPRLAFNSQLNQYYLALSGPSYSLRSKAPIAFNADSYSLFASFSLQMPMSGSAAVISLSGVCTLTYLSDFGAIRPNMSILPSSMSRYISLPYLADPPVEPRVVTMITSHLGRCLFRDNGIQTVEDTPISTGKFNYNQFVISTNPYPVGRFYGLVLFNHVASDAEIKTFEAEMSAKNGLVLPV